MKQRLKQSGNIFFLLFAAVGMAGVVAVSVQNYVMSPLKTANTVTRKNSAETQMQLGIRVAATNAVTQQASNGDCDGDGMVEPLPYVAAGGNPAPTGGGLLPNNIGSARMDPWGTQFGYCVWDHGTAINDAGCGGGTQLRLAGTDSAEWETMAIVSAGPDKVFQTSCNAWVDTTPADSMPDTPLVNKPTTSDDTFYAWSYRDASAGTGGGGSSLWTLVGGDPNTAEIAKNLSVKDGSNVEQLAFDTTTRALTVGAGGTSDIPTLRTDFMQAYLNPRIQIQDSLDFPPEDGSGYTFYFQNPTGDALIVGDKTTPRTAFEINSAVTPNQINFLTFGVAPSMTRFTNDGLNPLTFFANSLGGGGVAPSLIYFQDGDNTPVVNQASFLRSRHNTTSGVQDDTAQIRINPQTVGAAAANVSGNIAFHTRPVGTAAAADLPERMRISNNGNVGIGTNNPSAVLHVAGGNTILADGGFRVGVGTTSPQVAVDVAGSARVGNTVSACTAANNGSMRYDSGSSCVQFCDGSAWSCSQTALCGSSLPTVSGFTDATGAALSTVIESDIIQITGISTCKINVSISGASGSPQYRTCTNGTSDANCDSTVVQDWTSGRGIIENNQYVQIRMTSSSTAGIYNFANMIVGTRTIGWGITTTAGNCASPSVPVGTVCADGTIYVGVSPLTGAKTYAMPCEVGKVWDGVTCKGNTHSMSFSRGNTIYTTARSDYNGEANTTTLAGLSNADSPYIAAGYCENLVYGGQSDWYLPAQREAVDVFRPNCPFFSPYNLNCGGSFEVIWSSTDNSTTSAGHWSFAGGPWPGDKIGVWSYMLVFCLRQD